MSKNKEKKITSIGGQAIIEGVMMRGPHKTAMAVRKPAKEIVCKVDENGTKKRNIILRFPIIRGCINFVESLVVGMKALMFSADFIDIEDEEQEKESKFDKWLNSKFGSKIKDIAIYVSIGISLILSIGLFILLPTVIADLLSWLISFTSVNPIIIRPIIEGVSRMIIFITYLALVSLMPDIKRVFQYHGAEHKTIACFEAEEELTVENVKKHTRLHPRCGTSFLLFVMIVSIILFSFLPQLNNIFLKMLMRIALMPVVAGLSYEIIKIAGRSKNCCVRLLTKPGLWLQKLTTREPDDSQIEVAIESMKAVIPENSEDDKW